MTDEIDMEGATWHEHIPPATEAEIAEVMRLVRDTYGVLVPETEDDEREYADEMVYFAKMGGVSLERMVADNLEVIIALMTDMGGGLQ